MGAKVHKPNLRYSGRLDRFADEVWLIWSNKWGCWYRVNCQGYTDHIEHAGIYDRATAARHHPADRIPKHRVTEAIPLSSVIDFIDARIVQLNVDIEKSQRTISWLESLRHNPPLPSQTASSVGEG